MTCKSSQGDGQTTFWRKVCFFDAVGGPLWAQQCHIGVIFGSPFGFGISFGSHFDDAWGPKPWKMRSKISVKIDHEYVMPKTQKMNRKVCLKLTKIDAKTLKYQCLFATSKTLVFTTRLQWKRCFGSSKRVKNPLKNDKNRRKFNARR